MGYNRDQVDWTEEEHIAAEAADKLYEAGHEAAKDGFQTKDLAALPGMFAPTRKLYSYLLTGDRSELARKFISLGVMLERDNDFIRSMGQADGDSG